MITLHVNGQAQSFDGDPSMPVLWYLRDVLGLTGTKFGCGVAACGACTIHLDGDATRSCVTAMSDANGKSVTTIEGLDPEGNHPVQTAWRALNVPQCGYCQAGQIMQAVALLKQTPHPTDCRHRQHDVRQHLPLRDLSAHSRRHQASCGSVTHDQAHSRNRVGLGHRECQPARRPEGHPRNGRPRARGARDAVWSGAGRRRSQVGRRRHAARHGQQSSGFRLDCAGRNRHHRLPSLRDGAGHTHRHAADRRRRNGGRLGQGESRPGDRGRGQIRQPGHRRLPFDPAFLHADAPGGRRGPHDAGGGRSETLGRGRHRRGGEEPRGHSEVDRARSSAMESSPPTPARWACPRMSASKRSGAATPVSLPLKDPSQVPLHRQGRDQYRRRLRHHDGSRHLWSGCPLARAEIRRHCAPGGDGRQGRLLSTRRTRKKSRAFSRSSRCPRRRTR